MLILAEGIGAGNLDLAVRSQRFVEPREKIPDRAEKAQRPVSRLDALVVSHLCKMSEALQFVFEFVGGGGHFYSSLQRARSVRDRIGVRSFFSRTGCWPACPDPAPFGRPKEGPSAGSCPPSVSCFPCCLFGPSTWRCSCLK